MRTLSGYMYYPDSLAEADGATYFLVRSEEENVKYLGILGRTDGFEGGVPVDGSTHLFPLTAENARALRARMPWLNPQPLGIQTTAGFGDRLGLGTPGHIRAMQAALEQRQSVAPIFAQQSVRENARTHRTPQQVLDDAMWGVFQMGWRKPWGADADHLKTPADIDSFFDAGFTFFTIDPGDHVDNHAQTDTPEALAEKVRVLPWHHLNNTSEETTARYVGKTFTIEDFTLAFDEVTLLRALAKYGRAIAHTVEMAKHLEKRAGRKPFDLEISVDETETPTSAEEHFFIASELQRLGVRWTSMAPRFVGRFEKGVDYIGDRTQFEESFAKHAAIARALGGYRMSLHSGSDKFSIYAAAAHLTRGLLHLKTAGTSYLEALRVVAQAEPVLFRQILHLALDRYETDRATYHVSAELGKVASPETLSDHNLAALLDQFDARQVFHVTFGAALDRFGPMLLETLRANEDAYERALAAHFKKHLDPIA